MPFSAGIQQVDEVAILAEGEHRRGFFGYFLRRGPAFRSIAAAEDTAMLGIKQVEIPFFCFEIFYMRILHKNAPLVVFLQFMRRIWEKECVCQNRDRGKWCHFFRKNREQTRPPARLNTGKSCNWSRFCCIVGKFVV